MGDTTASASSATTQSTLAAAGAAGTMARMAARTAAGTSAAASAAAAAGRHHVARHRIGGVAAGGGVGIEFEGHAAGISCGTGETRQHRPQSRRGRVERLGQHAHLAHDGHEVGVAVPARHQVHVHVVDDAGAGRTAEVQADVHPLRVVDLGERHLGQPRQARDLDQLVVGEPGQRGDVTRRHHHRVAAVVGIQIQDDERGAAGVQDERLRLGAVDVAEDAAGRLTLVARHVGVAPG